MSSEPQEAAADAMPAVPPSLELRQALRKVLAEVVQVGNEEVGGGEVVGGRWVKRFLICGRHEKPLKSLESLFVCTDPVVFQAFT